MAKRKITDEKDFLFKCILSLETVEECYDFFEDLCTTREVEEMSRRIKAARMLSENKVYAEVVTQTKLSTATISRVNRCLKEGSDGYARVLERTCGGAEDGE
jgi:TrpR-related protein YerC/YecD